MEKKLPAAVAAAASALLFFPPLARALGGLATAGGVGAKAAASVWRLGVVLLWSAQTETNKYRSYIYPFCFSLIRKETETHLYYPLLLSGWLSSPTSWMKADFKKLAKCNSMMACRKVKYGNNTKAANVPYHWVRSA